MENNQTVNDVIIVGFTTLTHYKSLLFTLLLILYFIIIACNASIALVILCDANLHSPMYFLICTLSVIEIGIVTSAYPTLLSIVLVGHAHISLNSCFLQMYVFHSLVVTENVLLNIMAYDRYIAICNALRYHVIMTSRFCKVLISGSWLCGFVIPLALLILIAKETFCEPKEIRHLICDSQPLFTLACGNNTSSVVIELAVSSFTIILTSIFIVMTYTKILITIFKMKTAVERRKAFSTCASHLIVALFFYGSMALMYIQLQISYSPYVDLATALHQSVLTPLFSSLVYSLRNKELKISLKKYFQVKNIFNRTVHFLSGQRNNIEF